MRHLGRHVLEFLQQEDGPTAVEYAVMLALIILAAFVAITALGTNTCKTFNSPTISNALTTGT
jgi:pilus assembly protein Flp/PilA